MQYGLISMYSTKCKQSKSHTSLSTLCSHFLLSYDNQAMTKSATGGHGHVICMGDLGEIFLTKILQKVAQRTTKVHFSILYCIVLYLLY